MNKLLFTVVFLIATFSFYAQTINDEVEIYAVFKNGKWGVQNDSGDLLIPHSYDSIFIDNFNYAHVIKDSLCGIVNNKGNFILLIKYSNVRTLNSDFIVPYLNNKCALFNSEGSQILDFEYKSVISTTDNLLVLTKQEKKYLYNINDKSISKAYDEISLIDKNTFLFKDEAGKCLYLSEKNYTTKYFKSIEKKKSNLFLLKNETEKYILSTNKKIHLIPVNDFWYKELSDTTIAYKFNDNINILNTKSSEKQIINASNISDFFSFRKKNARTLGDYLIQTGDEIYAYIYRNNKIGIINEKFENITPVKYNSIKKFQYKYFIVTIDNKKGILDKKGKTIVPVKYDTIQYVNSFFEVKINGKTGIYSESGIKLKAVYEKIEFLEDDYFLYFKNKKQGIVKSGDKIISPAKYKSVSVSENSFIVCEFKNKKLKYGLLSKNGTVLITPKFESLKIVKPGILKAGISENKKLKYGLINDKGKKIVKPVYKDIKKTFHENIYKVSGFDYQDLTFEELNSLKHINLPIPYQDIRKRFYPTGYINTFGQILLDTLYFYPQIYEDYTGKIFEVRYDSVFLIVTFDNSGKLSDKTEYSNYIRVNEYNKPRNFTWRQQKIDKKFLWGLFFGDLKILDYQFDSYIENGYGENFNAVKIIKKNKQYSGIVNMKTGKLILDPIYSEIRIADFKYSPLAVIKNKYGKYALIDKEYRIVKKGFGFIGDLKNTYTRINKGGKTKFIDNKTKEYISLKKYNINQNYTIGFSIEICKGGKWGIIDSSTNYLINPQYDFLQEYNYGGFLAEKNKKWGEISPENKIIIDFIYDEIKFFSKYGVPFYNAEKNKKYGVIDTAGAEVIPFKFTNIRLSQDSSLIAFITVNKTKKNSYGYINEKGEQKTAPKFIIAEKFKNGFARVQFKKREWLFIDTAMNIIPTGPFDDAHDFSDNAAAVKVKGKWGYINKKGEFIIKPQYDKAGNFSEGLAPVRKLISYSKKGKKKVYVFINKNNEVVIRTKYNYCSEFYNGASIVWHKKKYGLINNKGKIIVPVKYKNITAYTEYGLFKIQKKNKSYAIFTSKGKKITPFIKQFSKNKFGNGLFPIKHKEECYYIDTKGNIKFKIDADQIGTFKYGKALIKKGSKYYYIDTSGKEIISLNSNELKNNFLAYKGNKIANPYRQVSDNLFLIKKENKKQLLINSNLKPVVLSEVNEIKEFSEGFAAFGVKTTFGLYDKSGNILAKNEYFNIEKVKKGLYKLTSLNEIRFIKIR